jgi:hypothetical protein
MRVAGTGSGKKSRSSQKRRQGKALNIKRLLGAKPIIYLGAFSLWAITSALAVFQIMLVRSMILRVLTRYFAAHGSPSELLARARADPFSKLAALVMTLFALAVLIGGFDFHFDNAGKRRSWVVFGWTLGIQLGLLLLIYLF